MISNINYKKKPNRTYQICVKCVMDTSDPWIEFDSDGICNHCKDYSKKIFKSKENSSKNNQTLDKMFDVIKKKRNSITKNSRWRYKVSIKLSG